MVPINPSSHQFIMPTINTNTEGSNAEYQQDLHSAGMPFVPMQYGFYPMNMDPGSRSEIHPQPDYFYANEIHPQPDYFYANEIYPQPDNFYANEIYPQPDNFYANEIHPQPDNFYANEIHPQPENLYADEIHPQPDNFYANEIHPQPDNFYADEIRPQPDNFYADEIHPQPDSFYADEILKRALDRSAVRQASYLQNQQRAGIPSVITQYGSYPMNIAPCSGSEIHPQPDKLYEDPTKPGLMTMPSDPKSATQPPRPIPSRSMEGHAENQQDLCSSAKCSSPTSKTERRPVNSSSKNRSSGRSSLKHLVEKFGKPTDFTIIVQNVKFYVHRIVLITKSPVFASTFELQLAPNGSDTLKMSDWDPEIFKQFIIFLYSGQVDELEYSNAIKLFKISDVFDVKKLKKDCVRCMIRDISVNTFCEVYFLAKKHKISDLLEASNNFFVSNLKAVMLDMRRNALLLKNPLLRNELILKAMECTKENKERT